MRTRVGSVRWLMPSVFMGKSLFFTSPVRAGMQKVRKVPEHCGGRSSSAPRRGGGKSSAVAYTLSARETALNESEMVRTPEGTI